MRKHKTYTHTTHHLCFMRKVLGMHFLQYKIPCYYFQSFGNIFLRCCGSCSKCLQRQCFHIEHFRVKMGLKIEGLDSIYEWSIKMFWIWWTSMSSMGRVVWNFIGTHISRAIKLKFDMERLKNTTAFVMEALITTYLTYLTHWLRWYQQ